MSRHVKIVKRSLLLGVFLFLGACSPQQASKAQHKESEQTAAPLLTLDQIFATQELKQGLIAALKANDDEAFAMWQQRIVELATQARLSEANLRLLSNESGQSFIRFEARKMAYQQDFMQAFLNFSAAQAVFDQYPELLSLHEGGRALITQRDGVIAQAAEVLVDDGFSGDAHAEAKKQWQGYMQQQQALVIKP